MSDSISILLGLVILVLGFCFTLWVRHVDKNIVNDKEVLERLAKIELSLAEVNVRVMPMWAKVQKQISEDLHHPHLKFKEMDGLLEKLDSGTLNGSERTRLKELLIERSVDMSPEVTESQRASALIMAVVMDKTLEEAKVEGELVNVELVGESPKEES